MNRKHYKIIAIVIFFIGNSFGQLSGSFTIPGGTFPTIKKAVDSLNIVGVGTGGVTFNVSAGYAENITAPIAITATGTASKAITFQKSGNGSNPLITRTDAGTLATSVMGGAGDAIVRIEGTDYITIIGINLASFDQGIEYGYLTYKPSGTDGCQHVTIVNCQISLTKGTSAFVAGIYIGNGTSSVSSNVGVTVTATSGINSNILLKGNTVQNVHNGILLIGSSATGFYDSDITIGQSGSGNTIQNFGGGVADTCYGVYFKYVNNPSVVYNTFNNTGGGGVPHIYNLYEVFFSIVSGNTVVNNNSFTINNSSTRTSSFIHNNNNTVISETYNNNTFSGILSTGTLNLIYTFSNGTPDKTASGNVVTGITKSGGGLNGYYSASSIVVGGTETISNNNFSNITCSPTGSNIYLIYGSGTTTHDLIISNNTVSNITGFGTIYGINGIGNNSTTINNNTIFNLSATGSIYGINFSGLNAFANNNNIYNLSSSTTGFNAVYGIVTQSINNNTTNINIYNNFISDLRAPGSQSAVGTSGINAITGTNVNIFYNTVYLKFTSTNPSNTSAAISLGDTSPNSIDLRDNIFVNAVDVSSGLRAVAINKSSNWLLNISDNTNNNLYYAGIPSSKHLIFFDGTNNDSTLVQYKSRLAPRESNAVTENPPFINSSTPPYNLHMSTTIPTQAEGKGTSINSPIVITTDYDGNSRNTTTPDIGADEFAGIPADLAPPVIVYTSLLNTSSTLQRTLNATITDAGTGVPTTPPGWPYLYWKKNTTGVWTAVTPSGVSSGVYTFNFGSGAALNDTVYYYIVAQDNATPPNVVAKPSDGASGFTYNPPAASIPPTTPDRYVITKAPLAGNYTVGSSGNYQTLTAAITDLNLRGVGAAVNFLLIDDAYSVNETFPLQISISNVSKPTSVNKVTIKPNTGKIPVVQGAAAGSALIRILDSYVIMDGSNSGGTDRSLTIQNTSSSFPSGLLLGSTGSIPISASSIKNCKVISGANYSSPNYGIILSDEEFPGIPGYFNNITIQNNLIQKSFNGIYCIAESSAGNGSGLLITGNTLNSTGTNAIHELGIFLEGVDGAVVSNNAVANLGSNDAGGVTGIWLNSGTKNISLSNNIIGPIPEVGGNGTPRGIVVSAGMTNSNITISGNELTGFSTSFGGTLTALYVNSSMTGVVIEKNKIHDMSNDNSYGFGARGIIIDTDIPQSNITIRNNFVWNIKATAKESPSTWGVGIGIDGSTGGVSVYFNSINLYGSFSGGSTAGVNAAFCLLSPEVTSVDLRDNIFVNKLDNTNSTTDKSYAINSQAPNSAFSHINYNDYYIQSPAGVLGYLGGDQTTLSSWRTATGQDANSISGSAGFLSNTDLHINPDSNFVSNGGFYFASVPNDIDGDTRNNPPDIGADEYTATSSNTFQISVSVLNGWNMVSIPGLNSPDQNVNTWWAYRDMSANVFKYAAGYQSVTIAVPGTGYWMKHAGARTYNTGDEWPAAGIQKVPHNSIPAAAGWNLIGGYELSVSTANITTIPAGLQSGPVYKYSGGYQVASTLDPGYGYWIKLTGAGQIVIPETLEKENSEGVYFAEDWGRITITDAEGRTNTLYAVKGQVDLNKYELPPVPPEGMFDVRYSSGRIAEDLNSIQSIELNGVDYPLILKTEGIDIKVMDENGKKLSMDIKAGEEITINDAAIRKLKISGEMIPSNFTLQQNYPNPFNPGTVIGFSLPENESNVKLSIYNILGETVAVLVNSPLVAGNYKYQWNAQNRAAGIYIYELRTDKFVSVKKMMLLK